MICIVTKQTSQLLFVKYILQCIPAFKPTQKHEEKDVIWQTRIVTNTRPASYLLCFVVCIEARIVQGKDVLRRIIAVAVTLLHCYAAVVVVLQSSMHCYIVTSRQYAMEPKAMAKQLRLPSSCGQRRTEVDGVQGEGGTRRRIQIYKYKHKHIYKHK